MTTPAGVQEQQMVPPYDLGNPIVGPAPAQLTCTPVPTSDGTRLALTIRTPSTTLNVFLTKDDAVQWAASIREVADAMSSLLVATGPVPVLGG